jgi:isochorismate hydrolase
MTGKCRSNRTSPSIFLSPIFLSASARFDCWREWSFRLAAWIAILSCMPESVPLPRSPELMNRDDTALLVVDVQGKLLPLIPGSARLVWNIRRLIDGAAILGLPVAATEQYPQGLGPTTPELAARLGSIPAKLAFSCGERGEIFTGLRDRGIWKMLVCGIETHVCVGQTVHDLLAEGFRV